MPDEDEEIDEDAKANTFEGYAEAFTIFAKYSKKKFSICAEHDEIFAAHDIVGKVSKKDLKRLAQLGWTAEDGSFHRFV
jgi:hypothetical protein